MPIYEFKCPAGHVTDHLSPIAQRNEARQCPICGSQARRKFESQIATRMRKNGVMHIPGYPPARLSHEQARKHSQEHGF